MDNTIKQSIEARRSAFLNSYEITDESLKKEINDLFEKMNELGKECNDVMEFESKFAKSSLSGEYTKLYTKMASTCEMISLDKMFRNQEEQSENDMNNEKETNDVQYNSDETLEPVRKQVKEEIENQKDDTSEDVLKQPNNKKGLFDKWFKNN